MLNDCNAKSAGQNEGDSGIYENTDILMRTDDSAPGGEKVVPWLPTFSPRAELYRTVRNNIAACILGKFPDLQLACRPLVGTACRKFGTVQNS